jgi:hypothetical protein
MYSVPPPPGGNMGHDAARGFLSGFAGCLGVGLAILMVLGFLLIVAVHH